LETSAKLIKALQVFLTEYRDNGFEKAKIEANNLSKVLGMEPVLKKKSSTSKEKTNV